MAIPTIGQVGVPAGMVTSMAAGWDNTNGVWKPLAVSASGELLLGASTAVVGKVDHTTSSIGHGVKTVTAAGTDEAIAASTAAKWVIVQAQTDNTGHIAVGTTGVDATVATGTGVLLVAGDSVTLPVDNLADVFIDATVTGDGVRYTYGA